jgi:plastocyanin
LLSNLPRLLLLGALAALAIGLPGAGAGREAEAARAVGPVLNAEVGAAGSPEAFRIVLTDAATGARVTHVDPGTYTINVRDFSTTHNFHLSGPGVNQTTDVETRATVTWTVTFTNGTYVFVCDAHPTTMRGSFTSGVVQTVPPVVRLVGRVGPRRTISLRSASGALVKRLFTGRYRIVVSDRTRADNFHLFGPRVNRRTGVRFRGSASWLVTLARGTYRYRSDAHRLMSRRFVVVPRPTP